MRSTAAPARLAGVSKTILCKFEGILPKGPYPPCLRMADRALLTGYPRNQLHLLLLLLLLSDFCCCFFLFLFLICPFFLFLLIFLFFLRSFLFPSYSFFIHLLLPLLLPSSHSTPSSVFLLPSFFFFFFFVCSCYFHDALRNLFRDLRMNLITPNYLPVSADDIQYWEITMISEAWGEHTFSVYFRFSYSSGTLINIDGFHTIYIYNSCIKIMWKSWKHSPFDNQCEFMYIYEPRRFHRIWDGANRSSGCGVTASWCDGNARKGPADPWPCDRSIT